MNIVIILLLLVIIALLLHMNSKLPKRDRAQEAIDRYIDRIQQAKEDQDK